MFLGISYPVFLCLGDGIEFYVVSLSRFTKFNTFVKSTKQVSNQESVHKELFLQNQKVLEKAGKNVSFRLGEKSSKCLKTSPYCLCELFCSSLLLVFVKPVTLVKSTVLMFLLNMIQLSEVCSFGGLHFGALHTSWSDSRIKFLSSCHRKTINFC